MKATLILALFVFSASLTSPSDSGTVAALPPKTCDQCAAPPKPRPEGPVQSRIQNHVQIFAKSQLQIVAGTATWASDGDPTKPPKHTVGWLQS